MAPFPRSTLLLGNGAEQIPGCWADLRGGLGCLFVWCVLLQQPLSPWDFRVLWGSSLGSLVCVCHKQGAVMEHPKGQCAQGGGGHGGGGKTQKESSRARLPAHTASSPKLDPLLPQLLPGTRLHFSPFFPSPHPGADTQHPSPFPLQLPLCSIHPPSCPDRTLSAFPPLKPGAELSPPSSDISHPHPLPCHDVPGNSSPLFPALSCGIPSHPIE